MRPCLRVEEFAAEQKYLERWVRPESILWFTRREIADAGSATLGIGEVVDSALHPITLAVALLGVNRIVVGSLRLQAIHTHPEDVSAWPWFSLM